MTQTRRACRHGSRCEPRTRAEAIYCVVHHSDVDARTIADRLAVKYKHLLDAANPDRTSHRFQEDWIGRVTIASGNTAIIEFLCREVGGVYLAMPALDRGVDEITTAHLRQVTQFGKQAKKLAEILPNGITVDEARVFDRATGAVIRAAGELNAVVQAQAGGRL